MIKMIDFKSITFDEEETPVIYINKLNYYVFNTYIFNLFIYSDILDMLFLVIFSEKMPLIPLIVSFVLRVGIKYYTFINGIKQPKWIALPDELNLYITGLILLITLITAFPPYYAYMGILNIVYMKLIIYVITHSPYLDNIF